MKKVCVALLLLWASVSLAIKGKDGDLTVAVPTTVNYFTGLSAVNTVGGVTLNVSNIADLNDVAGIYASASLSTGDLIMLYQAQGATYSNTSDTSAYGAFNLGNSGRYEVYEVISVTGNDVVVAENGTLCNANSLIYSYDLGLTQVIRVPQFQNLTVSAAGSIITSAWNGSRGGVLALDVASNLTVNGQITANNRGFRGGVIDNLTTAAGTDVAIYRNGSANSGAEKGESILGFQAVYDANNGRYGRGAPANGGGGGTSHNGGGGGGGNADNGVAWNGQGNPDNGPAGWTTAWNLDPTLNAGTTSSGGGRGGYSYGQSNQNALTVAPGNAAWNGNNRRERGGLGGRPLPFNAVGRLFFGGGGGAGDGNNSQAGAGGIGGGLIYIITDSLSGSGSITANGQAGLNTAGGGNNDAPGGGGAGGTIVVSANTAAGVAFVANGGKGGDQLPIGNENEGPGGGGGGGVISINGGAASATANGGANGISQSGGVTEFTANGATIGGSGLPNLTTPAVGNLPICRAVPSLTTAKALTDNADGDASGTVTEGDVLEFTVTVTNNGDLPLNNVVVSDTLITPNSITCPVVAVGGTCVLVGTYTVTAGDVTTGSITNTGTGDSDETPPVDDVVITPVVGSPALTTAKALTDNADGDASGTVTEGDVLEFTITVTNSGNIPLNNVVVSDSIITPNSTNCAVVAVGGTCVLVGNYTVTAGDVTTGSITNTGTGDSNETPPVDDVVITPVVGTPALTTSKALTDNADGDASGTVTEGDVLEFTITVTNSGNIPLNNVVVTDTMITPNSITCPIVAVGGTCVLVGNYTVTAGDVTTGSITNTGTGDSDETPPVDDVVITPIAGTPMLTTAKALTNNADGDASGTVTEGDVLEFTITVTNTGNIPLNNVVVTDTLITPNSITCPVVALGGTCVLVGNYTVTGADVTTGSITNTGTGDSDETPPVDDVVITPVVGSPALTTAKALTGNADGDASGTVTEGDVLEFTITVTNSGNIPLNNVVVTDTMITPNNITCPVVAVGGTCVLVGNYTVTAADVTAGSITNTGTGDSDETPPVDDVVVTPVGSSPALTTAKALTGNADGDASGTVTEGDVLEFTITVTNTGNTPLNNVVVTDTMITPNSVTCPVVALGGTCVLVGNYTVTAADVTAGSITNTGTGDSDETPPVDDVVVTPVGSSPALTTAKALTGNADGDASGTVTEGDVLEFTITVTNTGNTPLNNVVVTDTMITPNSVTCPVVALGGTCVLVGNYTVTAADVTAGSITNTGTGDSDETPPVDDVVVTTIGGTPMLTVDKSLTSNADEDGSTTVTLNDTLTFTIVVTNVGNTTLNNVTVTDDMITPGSTTCATLTVGSTCTLVGTYVVTANDVNNGQIINTAEGNSVETGPDPDSDIVTINVEGLPPGPGSPARVPTLSQWSLLMLMALLLLVGARSFRRS